MSQEISIELQMKQVSGTKRRRLGGDITYCNVRDVRPFSFSSPNYSHIYSKRINHDLIKRGTIEHWNAFNYSLVFNLVQATTEENGIPILPLLFSRSFLRFLFLRLPRPSSAQLPLQPAACRTAA